MATPRGLVGHKPDQSNKAHPEFCAIVLAVQLQYCTDMLDPDEISRLVHNLDTNRDGWILFKEKIDMFLK